MLRSPLPLPLFVILTAAGCRGDSTAPSPVRTATIQVAGETFRVELPTADLVAAAQAARDRRGPTIPTAASSRAPA